jgi:cytochrome c peroxidase
MNSTNTLIPAAIAAALASGLSLTPAVASAAELQPIEELGRQIFFDTQLSLRKNQSCASCHVPEAGWVGKDSKINEAGGVYEGSIAGEFGNQKPPSSAYATLAPILLDVKTDERCSSAATWDGRATGWKLGNPPRPGPGLPQPGRAGPPGPRLRGLSGLRRCVRRSG